jgi:hypothetical protein
VNHYIHQFIASAQKLKGISVLFLLVAVFFLFHEVEHRGKLETKIPPIGTNTKKFEALK